MWTTKEMPDQKGRAALVTGGNTGIGYETALALYKAGANVTIACRDKERGEKAVENIKRLNGAGTITLGILDLGSLKSIEQFAGHFIKENKELHVLINNAGVATPPQSRTAEGYELQFGVNFLGHFALTGFLYPILLSTAGSRIVTVSSNGYQNASIDFDNLKSQKDYNPLREYRQSKLANLMFAIELDRRIKAKQQNVLSIAAQPGANETELTRHLSNEEIAAGKERLGEFMEPWQGALSSLYAATSTEALGGNMYEPEENGLRGYPVKANIQQNARNTEECKKLWELAEQATGLFYP